MPQVQIIEPTIRPQKQKIRVCAYARVSSNSDDQNMLSVSSIMP